MGGRAPNIKIEVPSKLVEWEMMTWVSKLKAGWMEKSIETTGGFSKLSGCQVSSAGRKVEI